MLTDCVCTAVFSTCGWGASDNRIGEAGGVALAKAVESGRCQRVCLERESIIVCLAACASGLGPFRSGCHAFGPRCMRGLEGVGGALMLTDCVCTAGFGGLGGVRQRN